jgi:hypothetical protein
VRLRAQPSVGEGGGGAELCLPSARLQASWPSAERPPPAPRPYVGSVHPQRPRIAPGARVLVAWPSTAPISPARRARAPRSRAAPPGGGCRRGRTRGTATGAKQRSRRGRRAKRGSAVGRQPALSASPRGRQQQRGGGSHGRDAVAVRGARARQPAAGGPRGAGAAGAGAHHAASLLRPSRRARRAPTRAPRPRPSTPKQDSGAGLVEGDDPYARRPPDAGGATPCSGAAAPSGGASWVTPEAAAAAAAAATPASSSGYATPACAAASGAAGATPGSTATGGRGGGEPFATRETAGECLAFLQAALDTAGVRARLPPPDAAASDPAGALADTLCAAYELLRLLQRSNEQRERQDALIAKLRVDARTADRAAQRLAGASEQQGQEAAGLKIKVGDGGGPGAQGRSLLRGRLLFAAARTALACRRIPASSKPPPAPPPHTHPPPPTPPARRAPAAAAAGRVVPLRGRPLGRRARRARAPQRAAGAAARAV